VAHAIETQELTRSFASGVALDHLTLHVEPGEVLALLGPNGAGKTTTVRLLNGVLRPDWGTVRVLGLDPTADGDEVRRRTGVLTENAGLDDRLTAFENLALVGRLRGFDKPDAARRADELLVRFRLADRAAHPVQGFSTGERKRLALARALFHDPEVLFLDEPTSGLDPSATRDVVDLIGSLAAEHGRTIVLCTHFLGEAGRLAHRMAVLDHGHLHAFGRPEDLAAELWEGVESDLDLGGAASPAAHAAMTRLEGVLHAEPTPIGARVVVRDRDVLPTVVASLVGAGVPVYASVPITRTLEDVYFAIESRIEAEAEAAAS
jgi:ABC-2 type transport system ATP-binding protein